MNKFFNQDWNSMNWSDLQKQYIESVNSFISGQSKPQNPWEQAMNYWWKSNDVSMPMDQFEVFNKVMNQGKSFYFLGEQLSTLLELLSSQKKTKKNWMNMLEQQIEVMKQAYNEQSNYFQDGLLSEWKINQEALKSSVNFIPGFEKILDESVSDSEIQDYIEKYLSMPGLGLNRELQEKIQHTVLSFKRFQETNKQYNDAMAQVASSGLDLLKDKLIVLAQNKEKIESLRAAYDLWVDCNEEAYGEYVLGEEYSLLYGNVVNALMAFKKDSAELMNEVYSTYNMTSKNEFDELAKEQHQLKQKLKRAEQKNIQEQQKVNKLEKEIQELRDLVLNKKVTNTSSVTARKKKKKAKTKVKSPNLAEKKTTARKKTVSKKKVRKSTRQTSPNTNNNVIEIKF